MAGDWIAMRTDLWECPQVVRILSAMCPQLCGQDSTVMRTKCEILGALYRTWSIFDTHSDDGKLVGYTAEALNHMVGLDGWAENLQYVGWLIIEPQCLTMPEFSEWMIASAKRRLKDAQRKRQSRPQNVRKMSASCPQNVRTDADKMRTTEQNRTEVIPPNPPLPAKGDFSSRKAAEETFITARLRRSTPEELDAQLAATSTWTDAEFIAAAQEAVAKKSGRLIKPKGSNGTAIPKRVDPRHEAEMLRAGVVKDARKRGVPEEQIDGLVDQVLAKHGLSLEVAR